LKSLKINIEIITKIEDIQPMNVSNSEMLLKNGFDKVGSENMPKHLQREETNVEVCRHETGLLGCRKEVGIREPKTHTDSKAQAEIRNLHQGE
jgi:hypothetical protein